MYSLKRNHWRRERLTTVLAAVKNIKEFNNRWCHFRKTDKPDITTHPQNKTKKEGENVTLSCDASGNPFSTTFSWTVNGFAVTVGGRISLSHNNKQLTISNVTRRDSGQYRCVATNSVGSVTSNAATLNVQCKNTFTSYLCSTNMC